ncbi:MAG: cobalamin-dependent protein [Bacteroidales bacterium]|nr:cobalamin-dependent protein [Bacteroidales bacterium]HOY38143.1 cobalamin-dependent protein [Bacteroidales bacterium]HQP03041.1 cobalamin-dependent protein [Bacteroidales bacterium]
MAEANVLSTNFDVFRNENILLGTKVLLIYPPVRLNKKPLYPPFGLLSLAAVLEKAGAAVEILDLNMLRLGFTDLKHEIAQHQFDVIGTGGMATVYYYMKFLAEYLKKDYPNVPLIAGGTACSGSPDVMVKHTKFDVIALGEGEPVIIDIVAALTGKGDLNTVPGIIFRDKTGNVIKTADRPRMLNLEDMPLPAYHLIDMEKYISNSYIYKNKKNSVSEERIKKFNLDRHKASRPVMLFSKRGCPYECNFCYRNFGRKVVGLSVDYTLKHMAFLEEKYNTINFIIEDETFNIDRKWVMEFCDALIASDKKYILNIGNGLRANSVDDEMISRMKQAGFCSIAIGIESFYNPSLHDMNKKQDADTIINAIQVIQNNGFHLASAQLLFGYPSDGTESMQENITWCKALNLKSANFAIPCPYPGTLLYRKAIDEKYITDEEAWLMELADKDISDRVINMSGKPEKHLKKLILRAEDEIRMHFIRKDYPVIGHIVSWMQKAGRAFNLNAFEILKGIKDGAKNLILYGKIPGKLFKSGGTNHSHIKTEAMYWLHEWGKTSAYK